MKPLDLDGLLDFLRDACTEAGNQTLFAAKHGVSTVYLRDILSRNRPPGPKVLKALGFRKVVLYEREK